MDKKKFVLTDEEIIDLRVLLNNAIEGLNKDIEYWSSQESSYSDKWIPYDKKLKEKYEKLLSKLRGE